MAYVPVPKDLSKVKTKVAFNLTKRQIVCFAVALLLGLPLFFLLKDSTGTSLASIADKYSGGWKSDSLLPSRQAFCESVRLRGRFPLSP